MRAERTGTLPTRPGAEGLAAAVRGALATPFGVTLAAVFALTVLRLVALFLTPLELYPDEAQYWLWSRRLAFGYFSKPPVVAWLIAATTALGGDAEPWVRLSAPLLHAGAALALQRAGARLYDERTGLLAAAIYILMPAVQLSSGVIATDAPLLGFLAPALWSYAVLATARTQREGDLAALAFGTLVALAILSKYAAAYALIGAALHAFVDPEMRRRWTPLRLAAAVGAGLALVSPNIAWNAAHHFDTLAHTAANADWAPTGAGAHRSLVDRLSDPRNIFGFGLAQAAVFGPLGFVALVGGTARLAWRRRPPPAADRAMLAFALPPLILVLVQAALSRANANWAIAAYAPASVLAAAWLTRWRAKGWTVAGLGLQAAVALLFLGAAVSPALAHGLGLDNGFKRARGWRATSDWVFDRARDAAAAAPLSAIALDDRFVFNALSYYGRGRAWPAPVRMWVREQRPRNQAEAEAPLTVDMGARVLMVDAVDCYRLEAENDFARRGPVARTAVALDSRRDRPLSAFVGEGFAPQPRSRVSGLPPKPFGAPANCRIGQP